MRRRRWIQTVLAAPAVAALPAAAEAEPQQPPPTSRDEFAKIETAPSAERTGEPLHQFFSKSEYAALERLSNAILPPLNGKPGAIDAGVPSFLDFLISQSPAARQKLYRDGLAHLNSGKPLGELLQPLSEPWTHQSPADPFLRFLREAKDDILAAAFNSREWIEARTNRRGGAGTYYLTVD
jgi:hypothetical protein